MKPWRRWTDRHDAALRLYWGTLPLADVATRLRRTQAAVIQRSKVLRLGGAVPIGMEYLTHASRRTGYLPATLRMILRWARVRVLRSYTAHGHQRWIVQASEVGEAVSRWNDTETIQSAARRLGTGNHTLKRALDAAGVKLRHGVRKEGRRRHYRVRSEDIDRAWARRCAA